MSGTDAPPPPDTPARPPPPTPEQIAASQAAQSAGTGPGDPGAAAASAPSATPAPATTTTFPPTPAAEIPPARIAAVAGEAVAPLSHGDLLLGRTTDAVGGPLAPPTPQPIANIDATPAAQLDPWSAKVRARVMISTVQKWLAANPHPLEGDDAAVANFLKQLEARRLARMTATDLGQTIEPDAIDVAKSGPSPELYALADIAEQTATLVQAYRSLLAAKHIEVPADIQALSDELGSKVQAVGAMPAKAAA